MRTTGKIHHIQVISVFCCVCLCLLLVSQHALAVVVQVYEGETSVLLPCQDTGVTLKNRTVLWTRNDLDPKSVHLQREETDDVTGQNQRYRGRTSMRPDALDTLDFSLTLKNPQPTDSGIYTCSILNEREELKLTDIQLHVKVIPVKVEVEEGVESVQLPFKTTKNLSGEIQVIWECYEPFQKAHVFTNGPNQYEEQHEVYRDRTVMNKDLLETGDFSLTLKQPTERDSGEYKCLVWRKGTFIRKKTVKLRVKGPGSNRGHQDQKLLQ
ncbi:uncharacterized protein LOC134624290 isoform X1 [Pelmatolapia mariae]|uniref:uncharacterized protein LOC134624290 isoform X1 n=1 Tax=Pelmatolapia mariae TaxID=158779 RepID=UPI002FE67EF5